MFENERKPFFFGGERTVCRVPVLLWRVSHILTGRFGLVWGIARFFRPEIQGVEVNPFFFSNGQ